MRKLLLISLTTLCLWSHGACAQSAFSFVCRDKLYLDLDTCSCIGDLALKKADLTDLMMVMNLDNKTRDIFTAQYPNIRDAWDALRAAATICRNK